MLQKFIGPYWCFATPFSLAKGDELRSSLAPATAKFGAAEYHKRVEELVELSANLVDEQKMIAEYWSDGPFGEKPPGHWLRFAQFMSERD